MNKRVLYIWKSPYPWDVRAEKICNSLGESGFDVTMLARWSPGQSEIEEFPYFRVVRAGFEMPSWKTTPVSLNPYWKKAIIRAIERYSPDLIIPREIMLAEVSGKLGRKFSIPVVIDMAENYAAVMKGWRKYKKNVFIKMIVHYLKVPDIFERRSVANADGIITVCDEMTERFSSLYAYPRRKMQVVMNTPVKQMFNGSFPKENQENITFSYHGAINYERNLEVFIRGFAIASGKYNQIRLEIAGKGEETEHLIKLANDLNCSDKISFLGEYNHHELPALLSKTDIGILPFVTDEHINNTVANKLFDYMATGKPVLVSIAKPMLRIVNETQCGIAADCSTPEGCSNAIESILRTDLSSLGSNGRLWFLEKYNWSVDSANMLNFIKKYI